MAETQTICCYCGTGCGILVEAGEGRTVALRGDPDHPANAGRLCTKGSTLHLTTGLEGRALHPELRRSRQEQRQRASWNETLDHLAERFAEIIRAHGPDSVGFYVSGQLLTEDYYVFNKLARGLVGTHNIDSNSRLCMSSAVTGYKATLGADAPPACYDDIELTDCLFIAGSNTAYAHPVLFRRIEAARAANPELRLIVVDPRRTDTAAAADLHLAIRPGTDVALFNGMLHVMQMEGLLDEAFIRDHTAGFEALLETALDYSPRAAAEICGIDPLDLIQAALWFGQSTATLSLYCQGLNQSVHGTDKNAALINLHLATGHIGRPGAGPFSLTGQPNAMGGREAGAMATLLPGHRDPASAQDRAEVARLWGIAALPEKPGKTAVELFEAAAEGEIKALWIACTNPAQSLPHQARVRAALEKAELVVVQEAWRTTETAAYADVLLPATTWPEKEGTVTNSERRISRVRAALPAPGEARADWDIAVDFAKRLEQRLCSPLPSRRRRRIAADTRRGHPLRVQVEEQGVGEKPATLFPYPSPEEIFNEHRETTRGRDLDITGLSYALLEARGPQQWPFPEGAAAGKARLYENKVFPSPDGRARFHATSCLPPAEEPDDAFPLRLNTGRLRDQWHGMSRTGKVSRLFGHAPEPLLDLHPDDLARHGLKDGDLARIKSRRGEMVAKVRAATDQPPGQAFLPMHWGGAFVAGAGVNALTCGATDPLSRQPELKHAAVAVEKMDLPWRLTVLRAGDALGHLHRVQPLLARFPFASAALHGTERPLLVFQAAADVPADDDLLTELDRLLEMDGEAALAYSDTRRGVSKRIHTRDGRLEAVRLGGETAAAEWLKDTMAQGSPLDEDLRRWLLAPLASPPTGQCLRGKVVCSCLNVSEDVIREELDQGKNVAQVQEKLKCGTRCGSCLPEIRRMAQKTS